MHNQPGTGSLRLGRLLFTLPGPERGAPSVRRIKIISLAIMLVLSAVQSARSYETDGSHLPLPQFGLNLGGFVAGLDSSFRVGSDALGIGLDINLERVLDLETSLFVFRTEGYYRFGRTRSHKFALNYFDLRRQAGKDLQTDITIGDKVFTVGTQVNSYFNLRIIKGKYSYSFFQDERIDIAGSLGLYAMPVEFGVGAGDQLGSRSLSIIAPLPVIGMEVDVALIPDLRLKQSFEVLYLELQGFRGRILDINIGLEYNFWKNLGAGLAFNSFNVALELGEDNALLNFGANIKTGYSGLLLYVKFYYF